MIVNPIIQRELIGMLRMRKALAVQVLLALMFAALVIFRWPSDPTVDLAGNKAQAPCAPRRSEDLHPG